MIEPFAIPKERAVTPVAPDEEPTESLSLLIAEDAVTVTPASVVVDRPKDTPPP